MSSADAEQVVRGWLTALMRDGRAPLVLARRGVELPIRVVAVTTSAPGRPDGLRDDLTSDPGISFAVSEAFLQLDARALTPEQVEAVHEIFDEEARDFDWIGYSHQGTFDRAAIAADPTLKLWFSSAVKGAGALTAVLDALGIPVGEVTTSA